MLQQVQSNRFSEDIDLIRKAWKFCVKHHEGQLRASGAPYIIHPLEVAEVLAEMKMDSTSIAMCRDNKLPILVFNLNTPGNIMRMATGEEVGTIIS